MERLAIPWLFLGPSGSGKLSQARKMIEEAYSTKLVPPFETRNFTVGDGYEARVLASPYHFEIDIPNLSMQDKQIIGELLTTFFSSRDVFNSLRTNTRKLVILKRAHSLSLPAAIRVRAILQQFVLPPDAAGMIWITAREMTGPLALLDDAFVKYSVPRMPFSTWKTLSLPPPLLTEEAWAACEGRQERAKDVLDFFPDGNIPAWPRKISYFYDEMVRILIEVAARPTPPSLDIVLWIRGRIYQALSFCQTGPEILDSCAAALERHAEKIPPAAFWKAMSSLSTIESHTSYRTPLSLEAGVLALYETLRVNLKSEPLTNGDDTSRAPAAGIITHVLSAEPAAPAKKSVKRRAEPRKKASGE